MDTKNTKSKENHEFTVISEGNECSVFVWEAHLVNGAPEARFCTVGHCMLPFIAPGDEIEIVTTSGPARLGWIMTFRWSDRLLTHRVIRTEGESFWARGDLSDGIQGPVASKDVIGRVIAVRRDGQRHELSGIRPRIYGLVRNHAMAAVRKLARTMPGLRKLIEVDLLNSAIVAKALSGILDRVAGGIEVIEENDSKKRFYYLLSAGGQNNSSIAQTENDMAKGTIRVLYVLTKKQGFPIGSIRICQENNGSLASVWLVQTLFCRFPEKFLGAERSVVRALEQHAKKEKIHHIVFEVHDQDPRQARVLEILDFDRVDNLSEASWMTDHYPCLEEGKIRYHKRLD